jgi:hypothetical protein
MTLASSGSLRNVLGTFERANGHAGADRETQMMEKAFHHFPSP